MSGILGLFRKRLKKKVLVLVGVPFDKHGFFFIKDNYDSDLLRSYEWDDYSSTARKVAMFIKKVTKLGADVVVTRGVDELQCVCDYDIVVIVAHHITGGEEIEFNGNRCLCDDVVNAFPLSYSGIVDLMSCESGKMMFDIKSRCPQCNVIAVEGKSSLNQRSFLCRCALRNLAADENISYRNAYENVVGKYAKYSRVSKSKSDIKIVFLGCNDLLSTAFAPKGVRKGSSFLVQMALHKKSDSEEVELTAKMVDESAEVRNRKILSVKLKKGDKVDVQLTSATESSDYKFDQNKKTFYWDYNYHFVEFSVSVASNVTDDAFIGNVKIAVNMKPVGGFLFKTLIVENEKDNQQCAELEFLTYNREHEMKRQKDVLLAHIELKINEIRRKINESDDSNVRHSLDIELAMCDKCKEIIDCETNHVCEKVHKVFVSSTSDMQEYRMTLKEQIEKNSMFAEMFEDWQQSCTYPRDKCCEKVLSSDVMVCLIGKNYGYVEPVWGMSMTEIEYRIAEKKGIPILVYIDKNIANSMDKSQLAFVKDITTNRLVYFFDDKTSLAMQSRSELRTVKNELDFVAS